MIYRHPFQEKVTVGFSEETACPLQAVSRFHAARIPEPDDRCRTLQNDNLGNRMKHNYEPHRLWSYKLNWLMKP